MKAVLIKQRGSLHPIDDRGMELMAKIAEGGEVKVEISTPRNLRQLRLYWAIIHFCQEHCELFEGQDEEIIHISLKLATGLVRTFVDRETGHIGWVPKSISMES